MKYKVGDKVKVRSDLNYEKYSEGVPFTSEMDKFKGTVLEVRKIAGEFYEMVGIPYIFTDEMLEPVEEIEEMSAEEATKILGKICCESEVCAKCPISEAKGKMPCQNFRRDKAGEVLEILKQWKADHEKKDVEVEFACIVRVIEDTGDVKKCVYEEDIPYSEDWEEAQVRVLKEYCKDHNGKFFAVMDSICRVKE